MVFDEVKQLPSDGLSYTERVIIEGLATGIHRYLRENAPKSKMPECSVAALVAELCGLIVGCWPSESRQSVVDYCVRTIQSKVSDSLLNRKDAN